MKWTFHAVVLCPQRFDIGLENRRRDPDPLPYHPLAFFVLAAAEHAKTAEYDT